MTSFWVVTVQECLMLGTEFDLQQVDNSVVAMEMVLKAWLHEQGGDREHLHLLLPGPVCVKCDMQERLLSSALFPLTSNLGVKTESLRDFQPLPKASANHSPPPQRLKAIKTLRADGVCESVLYGLPLVIRPTTCWKLDWDEMETNHNLFHALCHTLKSRDLFLLVRLEPVQSPTAVGSGLCVYSHYVLQPSPSLSLLVKPVVSRELLLPCCLPVSNQNPPPDDITTIQSCLSQLEEDCVFNPLSLSGNLYQQLRSRGLLSRPQYPYRSQAERRDQAQPLEGPRTPHSRQPRQPQNQSRQQGTTSKVRATVAPLPSTSSSTGPPPSRAFRPALNLFSSRQPPAPTPPLRYDDDEDTMIL
ncbi:meiosis 1 arrest protein-like [Diretmus argenteus]